MKRILFIIIVSCLSVVSIAQQTQIYTSTEATYVEGVQLYHQGQYSASMRALQNYLRNNKQATNNEQAHFFLAANAFELRKSDAQRLLQNYLNEHAYTPYASEVYFMIGTLQVEQKRYKQALKTYQRVNSKELFQEHNAEYLFHCGYANLKEGEVKVASSHFEALLQRRTKYDLPASYYYAFCQYRVQNYGKALPRFLEIEHTAPYNRIVPYYIIQIYYAQGQYDEVQTRAEDLLVTNPKNENNGELHRILGEIYYQDGAYEQAVKHLTAYQELFTEQGRKLVRNDIYLLGMSYYRLKDWAQAATYLKQIEKKKDNLTENACFHLGNAYVQLGKPEEAKMAYSAAMRYNITPQIREEAMYNYALTTYESSTALGESVTAFTDFLKAYPNSKYETRVYELLCDAFMHSKNYKAALDALDKIAKPTAQMEDTKQYLRYQIGTDAFLQKKNDEAITYFTEVINHEPNTSLYKTESYYWRAECFYRANKYELAKQDLDAYILQKNLKQSQNQANATYLLAYTLFSQGKYQEAKNVFAQYVQVADKTTSTYADAYNRLGDCYFNERNFPQAEQHYAQVIALASLGVDYATFQRGYVLGLLKRYGDKIALLDQLVQTQPRSDYADDALYEIARAEIQREQSQAAIQTYDRLLNLYPKSNLARKAALEKAMLYYNMHDYKQAIACYKQVIKQFPASEEAYAALSGLQATYVETDNVAEYLAYTKTLGKVNMQVDNQEDSLTFIAAERQYMLANYQSAVAGLGKYISQFCEGGRYCTLAHYYYANSHYLLGNKQDAREAFKVLCALEGNPYMEEACTRVAEISYDEKDYQTALAYFTLLDTLASSSETAAMAQLGILRSSYYLQDHATTIAVAQAIISDEQASRSLKAEARYNAGKSYYATEQWEKAIECFTPIATEARTAQGAEANYMIAELHYKLGNIDAAEAQIMAFAEKNTQHQYWLAKAFVLLADIFVQRGDDFQAKQYLLSLQSNYTAQDDIQDLITERLTAIEVREQTKQSEQIDETTQDINSNDNNENNEETL